MSRLRFCSLALLLLVAPAARAAELPKPALEGLVKPESVAVGPNPGRDEAWEEPPAFDGCSTRGQAKPDTPQPIHIVRKNPSSQPQGARA